jgi:hypothetical protein
MPARRAAPPPQCAAASALRTSVAARCARRNTPRRAPRAGRCADAGCSPASSTARKRSDLAPLPLSAPLHFVASGDGRGGPGHARGPGRDLASLGAAAHGSDPDARLMRGAGFTFSALALNLDSPRALQSGGARRMPVRAPPCARLLRCMRGALLPAHRGLLTRTPRACRLACGRRLIPPCRRSRRGKRLQGKRRRLPRAFGARWRRAPRAPLQLPPFAAGV